jgi:NAD-dependent DNA ligase
MKTLEISNVGPGIITKIYDAGYDSLKKLINIKYEELLKIDGFKETSSKKIIESLKKINECDCLKLMDASNIMGRGYGTKKLKLIIDKYPYILNTDNESRKKSLKITIEDLIKVEGIAEISAKLFIEKLPYYYKFYDDMGLNCIINPNINNGITQNNINNGITQNNINNNLKDKKIVFSGFRNKDYEKIIENNGGSVSTSISKNTSYLIVADKNEESSKIDKAKSLNIPILSKEEFEKLL